MDVALGVLLGLTLAASLAAGRRLLRAPRVIDPGASAMQAAVHATTSLLPQLRRGLDEQTADAVVPVLRRMAETPALALVGPEGLLAFDGAGADHHGRGPATRGAATADADGPGDAAPDGRSGHPGGATDARGARATDARGRDVDAILAGAAGIGDGRVSVVARLACGHADCPLRAAIVAPIVVHGEPAGAVVALHDRPGRMRLEQSRVVGEVAALVSAMVELSELETQRERVASAELRALRAQISPHFIHNALAAVAAFIHSRPEEARELLIEFAQFIRYAFARDRSYVSLADELHYVETYLRLEQARFGDRLRLRVQVDPEVLQAVVPVLSLQPLVENAVRHGVEASAQGGLVSITGSDLGADVELRVADDGPGIGTDALEAALRGRGSGIGIGNVDGRLRSTFGPGYGLEYAVDGGTVVTMTVPKFHPGVRTA